ncbi:MAG TPA: c-type cytochrome [Acidobacteriaceae bacterium]|nr:c-type cytochrome [Acidobacteriaceae bacterium]
MRVSLRRCGLAAFALVSSCCFALSQQSPGPVEPRDAGAHPRLPADYRFTNLQVLPRDIPQRELIGQMREYMRALGVHCSFCHEDDELNHRTDFASDAKQEKRTARVMIRMVSELNGKYLATRPIADAKVTCYSCHRGEIKPLSQPPLSPAAALPAAGQSQ